VTEVVAWAASNGDRSENADYQYGKRRLRQIVADSLSQEADRSCGSGGPETRERASGTRAFFGATVRYANAVEWSEW